MPRLGGSGFFSPLPLSFIYYYASPWPCCCVNTDKSKSPHKQVQPELPFGQLPGNVIAQLGRPAPAQPPSRVPVQGMCPWAVNVIPCVLSLVSQPASWTQTGRCGWGAVGVCRIEGASRSYPSVYFLFRFLLKFRSYYVTKSLLLVENIS